jgi:hypothetical protein
MKLAESEGAAPSRDVRPELVHAIYGFGDASKEGFGPSIEIQGKGIMWRSGTFGAEQCENKSRLIIESSLIW